ncbi:hypothetical protein, partial [uncultured Microbacterium sp.]|uniref:hypothetical protein n=1 Tax=uncultured Microbacterium sp. TaxID=191216 RepID=UPI0025E1E887
HPRVRRQRQMCIRDSVSAPKPALSLHVALQNGSGSLHNDEASLHNVRASLHNDAGSLHNGARLGGTTSPLLASID